MSKEVQLTTAEREYLQGILNKGKHGARKIKRARMLLLLSQGATAQEAADKSGGALSTVYKIWNRYCEEGKDVEKTVHRSASLLIALRSVLPLPEMWLPHPRKASASRMLMNNHGKQNKQNNTGISCLLC